MARREYSVDEVWLDDPESLFSARYWNNAEAEQDKVFNLTGPDDRRVVNYIAQLGVSRDLADTLAWLRVNGGLPRRALDLAAGTCWLSAIVSREDEVSQIDAVEFSRHRIGALAPNTILSFNGKPEKIRRIMGSFYDVRVTSGYYDAVFMAAAFHHADRVVDLIAEVKRVLRPGGTYVLLHEVPIRVRQIAKRFILGSFRNRRLVLTFQGLFPPDPVHGDHFYMRHHYRLLLEGAGFSYSQPSTSTGQFVVVARKPG